MSNLFLAAETMKLENNMTGINLHKKAREDVLTNIYLPSQRPSSNKLKQNW